MTNLLRRGRLEVETDLLLGVEEVLLPRGCHALAQPQRALEAVDARPAATRDTAPSASPRRGFEADIFASTPVAARAGAGAPRSSAETELRGEASSTRVERYSAPAPTPAEVAEEPVRIAESVHAPPSGPKSARLEALASAHAEQCPHCTTATAHTRLVFGEGNPDAEIVFVGEAPGETEDRLGRPFVGRAGEKLDEMIAAMGLRRDDVYIANVLKSRPPDNRTPLRHEVEQCGPYLLAQIEVIRPKAIVTLGGPATKLLLASELGITRLRGVFGSLQIARQGDDAHEGRLEIPVMPTFHPAYLLRNYTPETRRQVWEDLKKVLALLGREAPVRR